MKLAHFPDLARQLRPLSILTALAVAFPRTLRAHEESRPTLPQTEKEDLLSSGFLLKLGFSFIVGLAVGYALKVALKVALVVGGMSLILLFSLQYHGIIEVNWTGMESSYDGLVDWLAVYAGGLKDFMADNLPSAASFTTGLLLALRL